MADVGWSDVLDGWLGALGLSWPRRRDPLWRRTKPRHVPGVYASRVLGRFVGALRSNPHTVILDLGPAAGRSVSFLGLELSCKLIVSDLVQGLEDAGRDREYGPVLASWLTQPDASVDGVLCWDLFDYLEPADAEVLAAELIRMLKPGGVAFAMFSTVRYEADESLRFSIEDMTRLSYRPVESSLRQRQVWLSRDVTRLFGDLRVDEAFLLKHGVREVLLRKPRWLANGDAT